MVEENVSEFFRGTRRRSIEVDLTTQNLCLVSSLTSLLLSIGYPHYFLSSMLIEPKKFNAKSRNKQLEKIIFLKFKNLSFLPSTFNLVVNFCSIEVYLNLITDFILARLIFERV